jgi:adenylate cyclase
MHGGGKSPPRRHLAVDVVGYSAKMGADDADTLARVRTLRTVVIEPLAATHGGRLFKSMGDVYERPIPRRPLRTISCSSDSSQVPPIHSVC